MKKSILIITFLVSVLSMSKENIQGILIEDSGIAIGKNSISTGIGTIAVGENSFASGNNLSKLEYEKLLEKNRLKILLIQETMDHLNKAKEEIIRLKYENQEVERAVSNLENLREIKKNKEKKLLELENRYIEEIEIKKGDLVSYKREIEDLERRLNIVNSLNFSNLDEDNFESGVNRLAIDLKREMEDGKTFIKEYGEDGIEIEKYESFIKQFIASPKLEDLEKKFNQEERKIFGKDTRDAHYPGLGSSGVVSASSDIFLAPSGGKGGILVDLETIESFKRNNLCYEISKTNGHSTIVSVNEKLESINVYNLTKKKWQNYNIKTKELTDTDSFYNVFSVPNERFRNYGDFEVAMSALLNYSDDEMVQKDKALKVQKLLQPLKDAYSEYNKYLEKENKTDVDYLKMQKLKYDLENPREFEKLMNNFKENGVTSEKEIDLMINIFGYRLDIFKYNKKNYNTIDPEDMDEVSKEYLNREYFTEEYIKDSIFWKELWSDKYGGYKKYYLLDETIEYFEKFKEKEIEKKKLQNILKDASEIGLFFTKEIERLKALEKNIADEISVKRRYIEDAKEEISNIEEMISSENPGDSEDLLRRIEEKRKFIEEKELEIKALKESFVDMTVGENAIAYGRNSVSTGKNSISFGVNNFVSGKNSIGVGKDNVVYSNNSYVIGNNNIVGTEENKTSDVFILGSNIDARKVGNAIVLGNNSEAVNNSLSIGSKGNERKIVNVADGEISENSKEAINGSQLHKAISNIIYGGINKEIFNNIDNNINLATASSIATASLPQVGATKRFAIGFGSGMYQGAFSFAIGASGQELDTRLVYKMNVSINTKGKIGAGFGINYSFGDIERPIIRDNIDYSKDMLALYDEKEELGKRVKELEGKVNNSREVGIKVVGDYEVDKYILTEKQQEELDKMIKELENRKIMITGYADIQGKDKYNLVLGLNRAVEVEKYLVSKGIKKDNILRVSSQGYNSMISKDKNENRRVEIFILK